MLACEEANCQRGGRSKLWPGSCAPRLGSQLELASESFASPLHFNQFTISLASYTEQVKTSVKANEILASDIEVVQKL